MATVKGKQVRTKADRLAGVAKGDVSNYKSSSGSSSRLPEGVAYQTYNSDGSVRESFSSAQYKDRKARDIATGVDTPRGVGGKLDVGVPEVEGESLDPNAQAPQGMIDQVNQATQAVNSFTKSRGAGAGTVAPPPNANAKYQQGLDTLNAQGVDLSTNPGQAMGVAKGAIPRTQAEPQSIVGQLMGEDANFDSIFTNFDKWMEPISQKTSLVDEYKKLSESLGIDEINEELVDAKRIIDGTEDDIRSEVTATGGFATESQVMALAAARNKSLIKNYNALLDTRDNAMQQLDTMMQLTQDDRKAAADEFDRKLGFAFKVAEFKERAQSNARSTYMTLGNQMGWDTLLTSVSPYERSVIGKTLGVSEQGLIGLAQRSQQDRMMYMQMRNLDIQAKQASIANAWSEIGERNKGIPGTPEYNAQQQKLQALGVTPISPTTGRADPTSQFASVMASTGAKTDDKLKLTGAVISATQKLAENTKNGKFAGLGFGQLVPNRLLSQEGQTNRTFIKTLTGTVESWMTGASVSEDQQKRIKSDMIPKDGDSDSQIRKKTNALINYMMSYASGNLASQGVNWAPQSVDLYANPIVSAPNGEEIEIID